MRPSLILCAALMALAACDSTEFDADPQIRAEAKGSRKCVAAVRNQTGDASAAINSVLPRVEITQFLVDVPSSQGRWLCQTDDAGTPLQLLELNAA